KHRPEDFLPGNCHVRGDVSEDSRLHKIARRQIIDGLCSTRYQNGAFPPSDLNIISYSLEMSARYDGTEIRFLILRVSDAKCFRGLFGTFGDFVMTVRRHDKSR